MKVFVCFELFWIVLNCFCLMLTFSIFCLVFQSKDCPPKLGINIEMFFALVTDSTSRRKFGHRTLASFNPATEAIWLDSANANGHAMNCSRASQQILGFRSGNHDDSALGVLDVWISHGWVWEDTITTLTTQATMTWTCLSVWRSLAMHCYLRCLLQLFGPKPSISLRPAFETMMPPRAVPGFILLLWKE